jgi:anti-sigma regulatory factor (Ser/Thr protein kinase)
MTSQLVCRPERDLPVAVLRVSGVLDRLTGDALRQAVTRSLSAQPEALLVDVADLVVEDPRGLDVVRDVVSATADWPAVPVVLCGAEPDTAAAAPCDSVELVADCDEALRRFTAAAATPCLRLKLRPVPEACRQVRHLVDQACTTWHHRELAATAALVATELVANVVRHARTTMEFTVALRDGSVWLTVRDGSRRLPRPVDSGQSDPGGRGLRLIRELTDSWGVLPVSDGKVVWSRIATA